MTGELYEVSLKVDVRQTAVEASVCTAARVSLSCDGEINDFNFYYGRADSHFNGMYSDLKFMLDEYDESSKDSPLTCYWSYHPYDDNDPLLSEFFYIAVLLNQHAFTVVRDILTSSCSSSCTVTLDLLVPDFMIEKSELPAARASGVPLKALNFPPQKQVMVGAQKLCLSMRRQLDFKSPKDLSIML